MLEENKMQYGSLTVNGIQDKFSHLSLWDLNKSLLEDVDVALIISWGSNLKLGATKSFQFQKFIMCKQRHSYKSEPEHYMTFFLIYEFDNF